MIAHTPSLPGLRPNTERPLVLSDSEIATIMAAARPLWI
jgi:hypothetical protein